MNESTRYSIHTVSLSGLGLPRSRTWTYGELPSDDRPVLRPERAERRLLRESSDMRCWSSDAASAVNGRDGSLTRSRLPGAGDRSVAAPNSGLAVVSSAFSFCHRSAPRIRQTDAQHPNEQRPGA